MCPQLTDIEGTSSHFDRKKLVGELPPDAPPSNPGIYLHFRVFLETNWCATV